MKQKWKQKGCLLLVICMIISMLPITAFAGDGALSSEELPIVEVGDFNGLKSALQSTSPSAIKLTGNIVITETINLCADQTLNLNGYELSIINVLPYEISRIEIDNNTLTIDGGGTVTISKEFNPGITGGYNNTKSTLKLKNVTVNLQNSDASGLSNMNIIVDSGAIINISSAANNQIIMQSSQILSINSGGVVNINNYSSSGIVNCGIENYGVILIDGGELNLNKESTESRYGINNKNRALLEIRNGGTLNGVARSGIYLNEKSKVKGLSGKFSDRGKVLAVDDQEITVEGIFDIRDGSFIDYPNSNDGLTHGLYVMNGTVFEKEGINIVKQPGIGIDLVVDLGLGNSITIPCREVEVTEGLITQILEVEGIATNGKTVVYQWPGYLDGNNNYTLINDANTGFLPIPNYLTAGTYLFGCQLSAENSNYAIVYINVIVHPQNDLGLAVGGVPVTQENYTNITGSAITGGKVSYNPDTKTLTLDNAKIAVDTKMWEAIYVSNNIDNLTINLIGDNQLGNAPNEQSNKNDYNIAIGIRTDKKINVIGSGNLTIYDEYQGIIAKDITIDTTGIIKIIERGDTAEACCLKAIEGSLEIKNGTLNLSSYYSNAVYGSNNILISGGTIIAECLNNTGDTYAFNIAPSFNNSYKYKVFAGANQASAVEINNPIATTFTNSKYVKIVPDTSGSIDDDNPSEPITPTPTTPTTPAVPSEINKKPVEEVLTDVGTHWALSSIQVVFERGLMTGTSSSTFSPNAQMNRGMLITTLGRLARINTLDFTSNSFKDVDMQSYYGAYAEWSLINKITQGTGNGNFSPEKPVTREELAVILVNFAKAMGYELPSKEGSKSFGDSSSISPWAKEAVEILRNANIINGDPSNNFNPKASATRAEIATVLQRFIAYMKL